jgi:Ino eighty subunit 1
MKAQLRTYHAIPSLQAHTDSNAYKQLQDAPRLKSILKGACEDRPEPQTLDQILGMPVPRTNPINLVFILSTYAPRVSETHFPDNMDFYDLVMRTTLSSKSRAKAFLWLVWLYLESNFTDQDCLGNPFGHGKPNREKTKSCCVPDFEYLTEEQAVVENVDTAEETAFGELKQEERKRW